MDNGEAVQVERIVRRKRGRPGEEIEVLLSDASSFFAAMRIWQHKPFHEGDTLQLVEVAAIQRDSKRIAVFSRATDLLARSEHSEFLLRQKLIQRGLDRELVEEVLRSLSERGLLDDSRYAASWVRSRIHRHPEGRSVLIAGLRQRGVSSSTAERAVDAVLEEEEVSMEVLALELGRQFLRARGANATSVAAKLMRRGFSGRVVRGVMSELTADELTDFD